jgi:hypothetical protein
MCLETVDAYRLQDLEATCQNSAGEGQSGHFGIAI